MWLLAFLVLCACRLNIYSLCSHVEIKIKFTWPSGRYLQAKATLSSISRLHPFYNNLKNKTENSTTVSIFKLHREDVTQWRKDMDFIFEW